jgi:hypothetical protein
MDRDKLLENIANWMQTHGIILSDRERSNYYTGVRIVEVSWQGKNYRIIEVDGMTCRIEKI